MDAIEALARVVTLGSAASLLATGLIVFVAEFRVDRSRPLERRGGALALVNFVGIGGYGLVGIVCAVTMAGSFDVSGRDLVAAAIAMVRLVGVAVIVASGVLAAVGIRTMGRHLASRVEVRRDTPLLSSGPFGLVRHPLYLSILMVWAGGALALVDVILGAGFVALVPAFVARARQEEELLEAHFGRAYAEYRRRVPMLVPWPRSQRRERPS